MTFKEYVQQAPMNAQDKAMFCLAHHGVKPASIAHFKGWVERGDGLWLPGYPNYEFQVTKAFAEHGINAEPRNRQPPQIRNKRPEMLPILVAKDESTLRELSDLYVHNEMAGEHYKVPGHVHRRIGELMDYPQSAIGQYVDKFSEDLDAVALLRKIAEHAKDVVPYLSYTCTEGNWREEIKTAGRWAEWTEQQYPEIHDELMKWFKLP